MTTKIAAIQMNSSAFLDDNLQNAAYLIEKAAKNGAKLLVLPEMFAKMGGNLETNINEQEKIRAFLSLEAKKNRVWIVGGTFALKEKPENRKPHAACLVYNDKGECCAHYNKIHLFDVTLSKKEAYQESDSIQAGNEIVLVDTPFGKLGLGVCYDLRFPELFRALFNQGAEIFVLPAAFTIPSGKAHWKVLARSRAIENFCYFIGACQGGIHDKGRKTYGHSLIISPWGKVIAEKKDDLPGIIYADLHLEEIQKARKAIPIDKHQRLFTSLKQPLLND